MGTTRTVGTTAIQVALAVGFIGIGLLGITLLGLAVTFPATLLERIVVVILGIGAIVIAIGYLQTVGAQL